MNCAVSNRQGVRVRDGLKVPIHQLKKLTACRMEMNGNHMETIWKPYVWKHGFGSGGILGLCLTSVTNTAGSCSRQTVWDF